MASFAEVFKSLPNFIASVNKWNLSLACVDVGQLHILIEALLDKDEVIGGPVGVRDLGTYLVASLLHELPQGVLVIIPFHPDVFN